MRYDYDFCQWSIGSVRRRARSLASAVKTFSADRSGSLGRQLLWTVFFFFVFFFHFNRTKGQSWGLHYTLFCV